MPSTHCTYDRDFRQEAANLLLSSGRPLNSSTSLRMRRLSRLDRLLH